MTTAWNAATRSPSCPTWTESQISTEQCCPGRGGCQRARPLAQTLPAAPAGLNCSAHCTPCPIPHTVPFHTPSPAPSTSRPPTCQLALTLRTLTIPPLRRWPEEDRDVFALHQMMTEEFSVEVRTALRFARCALPRCALLHCALPGRARPCWAVLARHGSAATLLLPAALHFFHVCVTERSGRLRQLGLY